MKTFALTLLAVLGLASASPAMAFGSKADIGTGIVPGETRS